MVVDFEGNVDDDLDFEIANDGASAEWSCSVGLSKWVMGHKLWTTIAYGDL